MIWQSTDGARMRLCSLETKIRWVDLRIKRGWTPSLEAERVRLEREHAPLYAAVEVMELLEHLPRCECGKVRHYDRHLARRHAAASNLIGTKKRDPPSVYFEHECWHVGHSHRVALGVSVEEVYG